MRASSSRVAAAATAILAAAIAGALGAASISASATTPQDFNVKTTKDLVTLCATSPDASDYPVAIAFCHGFAVGAYQYYTQLVAGSPKERFVCPPEPVPSRAQAISEYVAWTRQHPEVMNATPVNTIFRYLAEKYPCRS